MAIMYDHEVEVVIRVNVRSTLQHGLDYKDDVLDAVKEEIGAMSVDKAFWAHEIIETTVGDY
jgi:hypothetical protein